MINEDAAIRFKTAVDRLCPDVDNRILLAVSGGPDSLALLLLANTTVPKRIAAATVNHGLRPDAQDEARLVANLCKKLNVEHVILTPEQPITGNIQSAARKARYALLDVAARHLQCDAVATAHHADDQLETMLMRIARGSGIDGLAAIREKNGRIIRPLLSFAKSELEHICADAAIAPVRDPSNDDSDFDRVAMRQYLAARPHPFDAARAVRTASALADAAEALEWIVQDLFKRRTQGDEDGFSVDPDGVPSEIQRRLVMKVLRMIERDLTPRGDAVDRLLHDLRDGRTAMIGNILCKGGSVWHFAPAPPRYNV